MAFTSRKLPACLFVVVNVLNSLHVDACVWSPRYAKDMHKELCTGEKITPKPPSTLHSSTKSNSSLPHSTIKMNSSVLGSPSSLEMWTKVPERCNGNIALTLGGQMRTYRSVYPGIKRFILSALPSVDIFVSTWQESGQTAKHNWKERDSTAAVTVAELDDLYSPCGAQVDFFPENGYDEFRGVKRPGSLKSKFIDLDTRSSIPNFYKIFAANELKREAEKRRGRRYDLVIRLRPDLELLEPLPAAVLRHFRLPSTGTHGNRKGAALHEGSRQVVYSSMYLIREGTQVSDKLALGASAAMDYYASVWSNLKTYWMSPMHGLGEQKKKKVVLNGERLMKQHMNIAPNGITTEYFTIKALLRRTDGSTTEAEAKIRDEEAKKRKKNNNAPQSRTNAHEAGEGRSGLLNALMSATSSRTTTNPSATEASAMGRG